ncbi:MAG TPA: hypothetical protein VNF24_08595 [Candidatus Acidoferrales bacterium]|nr:hypothetical protein [Candidatus Acidoferrales bacterium]
MTSSLAAGDWVLAVDGSVRDEPLVVLVASGGEVTWELRAALPAPVLITAVREALLAYRERIGSIVAIRGPGSYIGVRGGLAAALGAAQSLGRPLALVGTMEAVAAQVDPGEGRVLALADAGRGGTFGQEMGSELSAGRVIGWRPLGGSLLLARGLPWPDAWADLRLVIGTPGEGRQLPLGTSSISPIRGRRMALAWLVTAKPIPISGYDQVTADYAEPIGAR